MNGEEHVEEVPAALLDCVRERAGGALRFVGRYREGGYHVEFADSAVTESYADTDLGDLVDDLRLQGVDRPRQESLHCAGELRCTIRSFEDALVFHLSEAPREGTFISVEPGVGDVSGFVGDCLDALGQPG
jgi:hypothetical protein